LDAPWSIHAPKLLLWLLVEGLLIAVGIITGRNLKEIYGAAQVRHQPCVLDSNRRVSGVGSRV
jgi:hypothetical protein